ncbi:transposase family protein, partial [Chamaesiphon sp.]|uniref:transposase family protein n=1 Tax=Chamaesiphon sp. TaxID=2814140 RepID=UPI0035933599
MGISRIKSRYEDYIYSQVKQLTVEQVSSQEQLTPQQVKGIFSRIAERELKKSGCALVGFPDGL